MQAWKQPSLKESVTAHQFRNFNPKMQRDSRKIPKHQIYLKYKTYFKYMVAEYSVNKKISCKVYY